MSTELLTADLSRDEHGFDEVQLAKGQTYALRLDGDSGLGVTVLSGCFWVTTEGDPLDYVATPEAPLVLRGGGLVVLEGIDDCNVLTRSDWRS